MELTPRRVLYVEGNVDGTVGGSYFSLFHLVSALDRRRYEPLVVFAANTPLLHRFHSAGVRTMIRPMPAAARLPGTIGRLLAKGLNFWRGLVVEPLRLSSLLRQKRVDLVHLNNSVVRNHPWMIAARLTGVPCITHERGINERFPARARWLARGLKAIVCISAAVRDNLTARGLGNLPLVTIHNGLDPDSLQVTRSSAEIRRELRIGDSQRLVGMIGNVKAWKGQEIVIRALGLLRDDFPALVCVLIGDTSPDDAAYRKKIDALIERLGLRGRVLVTGHRTDVANYIAALEIQVHASIAPEPFGRVLLEGMAFGKPLVASGGGAVPEIVVHGQTGLLFEPGRPESLASALRVLLNDPARAAAMGNAGRQRLAAEFSIQHNVSETQALYDRLLVE